MLSFVRQYRIALLWSFLMHAALAGVLTISVWRDPPLEGAPGPQVAIEATVVDSERIQEEMQALEDAEQAEARRLREEAEAARRAQQEEEQRLEALREQREQAELQRQQELAEQRRAEEEAESRRAAEAEAERQRQAELEAQRQAEADELRRQQEAERERLAELERQRKAEEERLARLEAERLERERQQREAALRRELAEEERRLAAEASGLLDQYRLLIEQQIERNWIRPPGAAAGLECVVQVTQIPSGEVVGVRIGTCNGDAAVIRSIEAAVYRASPLPLPRDPTLFDRNLELVFRPDS